MCVFLFVLILHKKRYFTIFRVISSTLATPGGSVFSYDNGRLFQGVYKTRMEVGGKDSEKISLHKKNRFQHPCCLFGGGGDSIGKSKFLNGQIWPGENQQQKD